MMKKVFLANVAAQLVGIGLAIVIRETRIGKESYDQLAKAIVEELKKP